MSETTGFRLEGLEELQRDIDKVFRKYPEEASKKVFSLAGEFTRDVNAKFPSGYSSGKGSISRSWKKEREKTQFSGYTIAVNIRNKASHFHLVENGHEGLIPENGYAIGRPGEHRPKANSRKKKSRMKSIGFIPGKHYCEKTRNEWKDKLPEKVEDFIDEMLGDENL